MLFVRNLGYFKSETFPLHCAFFPKIEAFGYKIGIVFNNTPLVVEENNCTTKTVYAYIVCDLNDWPTKPVRNVTLRNNCLVQLIQEKIMIKVSMCRAAME